MKSEMTDVARRVLNVIGVRLAACKPGETAEKTGCTPKGEEERAAPRVEDVGSAAENLNDVLDAAVDEPSSRRANQMIDAARSQLIDAVGRDELEAVKKVGDQLFKSMRTEDLGSDVAGAIETLLDGEPERAAATLEDVAKSEDLSDEQVAAVSDLLGRLKTRAK